MNLTIKQRLGYLICLGYRAAVSSAGDWPMWRFDAGRTASSVPGGQVLTFNFSIADNGQADAGLLHKLNVKT